MKEKEIKKKEKRKGKTVRNYREIIVAAQKMQETIEQYNSGNI